MGFNAFSFHVSTTYLLKINGRKYLLSIYYVPGIILCQTGDIIIIIKKPEKNLCPLGAYILGREGEDKQVGKLIHNVR